MVGKLCFPTIEQGVLL